MMTLPLLQQTLTLLSWIAFLATSLPLFNHLSLQLMACVAVNIDNFVVNGFTFVTINSLLLLKPFVPSPILTVLLLTTLFCPSIFATVRVNGF